MKLWTDFLYYYVKPAWGIKIFFLISVVFLYLFFKTAYGAAVASAWNSKNRRRIIISLVFLGVFLRFVWLIWTPYAPGAAHTEDVIMLRHAHQIATGQGFIDSAGASTAGRPVGYPFLLSLLEPASGNINLFYLGLLNILLAGITLCVIYIIGDMLGGALVGVFALVLTAFYPTLILSTKIVFEEHFYIPIFLGGIAFLISDYKKPQLWKLLTAAMLTSLSAYFRPFSSVMAVTVFIVWCLGRREFRKALVRAVIFQFILILVAMPWAIRNQCKLGKPVLYTTLIGGVLYYGNNENPNQVIFPLDQGGNPAYHLAKNEIERNAAGLRLAKEWIAVHPQEFLYRVGWRLLYFLGLRRESWVLTDNFHTLEKSRKPPPAYLERLLSKIENQYYVFVFLWAAVGCLMGFLKRRSNQGTILWIIVTILCYLAIIGLTMSHRKYRYVIEPLFCLLAAYGMGSIARLKFIPKMPWCISKP